MNLELLDPFRRQIPDRVDSTLSLPNNSLLQTTKRVDEEQQENNKQDNNSAEKKEEDDKGAYHVAFNRRGTYLAVGHAGGTVAVHDFMSRTLSALYRPPETSTTTTTTPGTLASAGNNEGGLEQQESSSTPTAATQPITFPYGVTSVTWARRSKTLLAGAVGDSQIRLFDTTHPLGPDECCCPLVPSDDMDNTMGGVDGAASTTGSAKKKAQPNHNHNDNGDSNNHEPGDDMTRQPRVLTEVREIGIGSEIKPPTENSDPTVVAMQERHEAALKKMREQEAKSLKTKKQRTKRYATLLWNFSEPVGGSLQVHPRQSTCGLAVLQSGALVLFCVPPSAWESYPLLETKPVVKTVTLYKNENHKITCAAFDPYGDKIYAAAKNGVLLGFEGVSELLQELGDKAKSVDPVLPTFQITIPASAAATVWHLLVSRNGKYVLLNCADSALRLYTTSECWTKSDNQEQVKPTFVFQDVVSKAPFASCDFSGDGEYVVGGCNGSHKYELYLWNTATGALMDRLSGAQVSLYSVTWHPTRSFLAVATSDGLVDVWGPRMDWTAFAPDFQALPMNVEYVEQEDEFDVVVVGDKSQQLNEQAADEQQQRHQQPMEIDEIVDVVTVDPVPVFASDSESESDVFYFDTKVKSTLAARGRSTFAAKAAAEEKE